MAIRKNKRLRMKDYLVAKLEGTGEKIDGSNVSGIGANCISVGNEGIVLLMDQTRSGSAFRKDYGTAREDCSEVGIVFYKDGDTFFRSDAQKSNSRLSEDRSLKEYNPEQVRRMISLTPAEIFARNVKDGITQYFQPESERLGEGLETFKFTTVLFDYSHIPAKDRYGHVRVPSKKIFLWENRWHFDSQLELRVDGLLTKRTEDSQ